MSEKMMITKANIISGVIKIMRVRRSRVAQLGIATGMAFVAIAAIIWGTAPAQQMPPPALPAVRFAEAPLIGPTTANAYYSAFGDDHTVCGALCPNGRPAEIKEIAKALGANRLDDAQFVQNAFEFVYN